MKNSTVIFAILGGAIAGAAAALLLTPSKGEDVRESIKDYVKSICPHKKASKVQEIADRIAEEISAD